jgi:hypothetical protein
MGFYSGAGITKGMEVLDYSQTGVVSAGATETVTIQPPPGIIYVLRNLYFHVRAITLGGGLVNHYFYCRNNGSVSNYIIMISKDDTQMLFYNGEITADSSSPSTTSEIFNIATDGRIKCDYNTPLELVYDNTESAANQTNTRSYFITVEKVGRAL